MERRVRYEVLRTDDDDDETATSTQVAEPIALQHAEMIQIPLEEESTERESAEAPSAAPPVYNEQEGATADAAEKYDPFMPPSYNVATTLPSYEEAERTKQEEEERRQHEVESGSVRDLDRFTEMQLGTDGMFLCMFLIAFVFNWVGLLASLCLNHTVAGRFGAISGFGLSMVKWVLIVKHNNWIAGMADGESWLWWLLIILGFLLFFRGCTQYIRLKYQWHRLSAQLRNQAYFMF